MKDFRTYLTDMYPNHELHNRFVRDNDIMGQDIVYGGKLYRIRLFDVQVIHWCRV